MNKYLLFAGREYYPQGGWSDFIGHYNDLDQALAASDIYMGDEDNKWEDCWWEIIDRDTMSRLEFKDEPVQ